MLKRIGQWGLSLAKSLYGRGFSRYPFIIGFWEFFCSRIARFEPRLVDRGDMRLWVDPADMGCGIGLLMRGKNFDNEMVRLYGQFLGAGKTMVDVGANIGFYSILSAKIVGDRGTVVAFEPNPYNFRLLERNIKENGITNIHAVQKAAADRDGTMELFLYPQQRAGSARARIFEAEKGWKGIGIEATTIDGYLAERRLTADLVKIDVEGGEEKVFHGMRETIRKNHELALIMEFVPRALRMAGSSPERFIDDVLSCGFNLYSISESGLIPLPDSHCVIAACPAEGGINILAVRKALPMQLQDMVKVS